MNLLLLFIILNVVNVVFQTLRSLATIKCGKMVAAVVNAVTYGLYTVVIIYMNADLPLWQKVAIVSAANFIGVYVVKLIEEKVRKDKLWKVEATIHQHNSERFERYLKNSKVPYSKVGVLGAPYVIFNIYCANQQMSREVNYLLNKFNAKFFVSETKNL